MVLDFERFDGTRGTMVASTEAISDKAGKIINYVAVAMDITTLRQAEKALEKSEKNALDLVEKLRQVDQNKNAFINRLSHELRNPLASIMMALELIEKTPSGSQQALKALDIVKRQSKLLKNLVDDLLDVTRITQNKVCLKKDVLEINNLVEKVIQDYQPQFIEKNVKLEFKSSLPIYMKADYSRLTQAIGNLLHNAAKFTNEDDLVIVSVAQDADCSEAVITVEDTGQGMDPKDQLNLFKPFMQADKPLGLRHEGLGLGLSIVKGIVEHHGGRVEAFSEGLGRGAKFTIRLPL
jgi:signal transduction histidine kinase